MYLGISFLTAGILLLVGIVIDTLRNTSLISETVSLKRSLSYDLPPSPLIPSGFNRSKRQTSSKRTAGNCIGKESGYQIGISPKVTGMYAENLLSSSWYPGNTRQHPVADTIHTGRDIESKKDRILNMSDCGESELDIARELGITRDEVAMVINLHLTSKVGQ